MPKPLLASVTICQRILQETDAVFSLIRVVDIFYVDLIEGIPPEKQTISASFLASIKFPVGSFPSLETVRISLVLPDDNTTLLGTVGTPEIIPDKGIAAPLGFSVIGQVQVAANVLGTYYVVLSFEEEEVARAPFTLAERTQAGEAQS